MDATSVQRIESELHLELPEAYRRFLLNCPQQWRDGTSVPELSLCTTAAKIIALNQDAERLDDWPNEYLAIGETGNGGYFVIDLGDDDPAVDLWSSACFPLDPYEHFDSVEQFASALLCGFEPEHAGPLSSRPADMMLPAVIHDVWSELLDDVLALLARIRSGLSRKNLKKAEEELDALVMCWINSPYSATPQLRRLLERTRDYRQQHPRVPSDDFEALVDALLVAVPDATVTSPEVAAERRGSLTSGRPSRS